ncbi:MAG TPA: sigma factor-like helix-turn-helix DNA-binding protein, partial [Gemmataceae bacterium]|nr:sigma factor-like helix-turn-helix DNA-binding protein [Gemmataceae bacterium]
LYGVAYRTALRAKRAAARRRHHEGRTRERVPEQPVAGTALRELQALLDKEVARLPEKYRAPFVLSCLQGKSRSEVAAELGWKEGTVSGRLARARQHLRQRLLRLGVTLSATLCASALTVRATPAAMPSGLATATVKTALLCAGRHGDAPGLIPARVAVLAKAVGHSMFLSRYRLAALLAALSVAVGSAGLLRYQAPATSRADPPQATMPRGTVTVAPTQAEAKGTIVNGRVLGPDGKPFAGAALYLWKSASQKKADRPAVATTGADGRFRFTLSEQDAGRGGSLIAFAHGFGPGWTDLSQSIQKSEVTLRLAKDNVSINGRIVGLEGKGIAGASVQVRRVEKRTDDGDLTPWIATKQQWAHGNYVSGVDTKALSPEALELPASVSTDREGRFRLSGFGNERIVHLKIQGDGIENSFIEVITRDGPLPGLYTGNENSTAYGAAFERVVCPAKPIVGTVRERGSGKPLAGISVFRPGPSMAETVTDADGRYRLAGASKSKDYTLQAWGFPYFNHTKHQIADTPGFEPLTVNFELDRGIELRVRVTDRATGSPLRASVGYEARHDNPHLNDYPSLRHFDSASGSASDPDGWQRVLAIPGPGWLLIKAEDVNRFIRPDHYDGWDGGLLPTPNGTLVPGQHHRIVPINLEKGGQSPAYDLVLESGQARTGTVLGPDGKRLTGVLVAGLRPIIANGVEFDPKRFRQKQILKNGTFTAFGVESDRARTLVFYHAEKKLGKVQAFRGDQPGPLSVRLEPLGAVTGRLLDDRGRPLAGQGVRAELTRDDKAYHDMPWELLHGLGPMLVVTQTTDATGRFRLEGLLPGLSYTLIAGEGDLSKPDAANVLRLDNLAVQSGRVKDLGDLRRP